jgi:hypothetical protein
LVTSDKPQGHLVLFCSYRTEENQSEKMWNTIHFETRWTLRRDGSLQKSARADISLVTSDKPHGHLVLFCSYRTEENQSEKMWNKVNFETRWTLRRDGSLQKSARADNLLVTSDKPHGHLVHFCSQRTE